MKQYPIWFNVTSCIYNSSKSFGAKDTSEIEVLVGSSSKNSNKLCDITTTKREKGIYYIFKLSVDNNVIVTKYFNTKTKQFSIEEPLDYEK